MRTTQGRSAKDGPFEVRRYVHHNEGGDDPQLYDEWVHIISTAGNYTSLTVRLSDVPKLVALLNYVDD